MRFYLRAYLIVLALECKTFSHRNLHSQLNRHQNHLTNYCDYYLVVCYLSSSLAMEFSEVVKIYYPNNFEVFTLSQTFCERIFIFH